MLVVVGGGWWLVVGGGGGGGGWWLVVVVVVGGGGGGWWLLMLLLMVVVLLLLRVRIPQVHLPHPRPVPLSAVVASARKHTHTQIAHRTNPDRHCTPHVPARCSPLLTTDGAYRDGK